jgi:hypothetical protein
MKAALPRQFGRQRGRHHSAGSINDGSSFFTLLTLVLTG